MVKPIDTSKKVVQKKDNIVKKDKKEKPNPPKKFINKPINVPVMRCINQLKELLNANYEINMKKFKEDHTNFLEKDKIYAIRVRKETDADEKTNKKVEYEEWKKSEDRIGLYKELKSIRKDAFRISGKASRYISLLLEFMIRDIVKYGINVVLDSNSPKQSKLKPEEFRNIALANLVVYPLIGNLKALQIPDEKPTKVTKNKESKKDKDKPTKEEQEDSDDAQTIKTRSSNTSYKMVTFNIFKNLVNDTDNQKLCCGQDTKSYVSSIITEFIDSLNVYLSILVSNSTSASTINEKHVFNACKLLYYYHHRNFDEYSKMVDELERMYKTKFPEKEKEKEKTKEKENKKKTK